MLVRSLLLILGVSACSTAQSSRPSFVPYNGYGEETGRVSSAYSIQRSSGASDISVLEIPDALDELMSLSGDQLILLPNRLDKSQLDYSLESLEEIDAWLSDIHTINALQAGENSAGEALTSDGRGDNTVLFAGLYLGEVIRANSEMGWHWERFDTFIAANPHFSEYYGIEEGLDTFVLVGPQGVATPINTALKRVVFGREESLTFIGKFLVQPVNLEETTSGLDFFGLESVR